MEWGGPGVAFVEIIPSFIRLTRAATSKTNKPRRLKGTQLTTGAAYSGPHSVERHIQDQRTASGPLPQLSLVKWDTARHRGAHERLKKKQAQIKSGLCVTETVNSYLWE